MTGAVTGADPFASTKRRRRATGTPLFASGARDPRARRPTDVALLIVSLLAIIVLSVLASIAADLDIDLSGFLTSFPPFLDPLWRALAWSALMWAVVVLGAALVRRRPALARDIVAGVVLAFAIASVLSGVVDGDAWAVIGRLGDFDGPPAFPPGAVVITAAALAVASPHLSRPIRHFGRWLIGGQLIAMLFLGGSLITGTLSAIFVGLLAAATVHLIVGSPGGLPTASRIELALAELGIDVVSLAPARMQTEGVVRFAGEDRDGPIDVKVYGRDAWDAQLLANLWRLAWYRGAARTTRLTRLELVEHEAFITLMAERAGVPVPPLVTAGNAGQGDALIVLRSEGLSVPDQWPAVTDAALEGLWADLERLHQAGIAHQRLELDRLRLRADGSLSLADLSSATVLTAPSERRQDDAQALAVTILLAGEERAVAVALQRLGADGLLAVLPYLQMAAMSGEMRDALDAADVDLDKLRNRVRTSLGAPEQDLIRLRRVTAGSVLNLALLVIAASVLISAFGDIDLATFAEEVRDASWWWIAFAMVLAQLPRLPGAWSTMGSIATPLPPGPVTALEFAVSYVNLAIPSTAARVAIHVRFFQRFGVKPAEAMTAGMIDSVSGFVVQIFIFLVLFFTSDLDLDFSTDTSSTSGAATIVLIVIAVIAVAIGIVLLVAPIRRRVFEQLRNARAALRVLRSPMKLTQLFGGNLLSQVLFAIAFGACTVAFHQDLPLSQLLLINTVVSLFAGLLPIPGGIGVTEAGLAYGLTTAGVPAETAFAIAITYRIGTFYLPPIWGWGCYQWLIKRRYL